MNEFAEDERGLIGYKIQRKDSNGSVEEDEIIFTEEIISMMLRYGKKLSEIQAGGTVKDCVITIPSYYTLNQRRLFQDAAELAGLSVL
jgi:molecular chaperone DnaK (HSP70)